MITTLLKAAHQYKTYILGWWQEGLDIKTARNLPSFPSLAQLILALLTKHKYYCWGGSENWASGKCSPPLEITRRNGRTATPSLARQLVTSFHNVERETNLKMDTLAKEGVKCDGLMINQSVYPFWWSFGWHYFCLVLLQKQSVYHP